MSITLASLVLLLIHAARATGGSCDVSLIVEFKMASTNRVKTGMVGFLSATNSNTPELLVYRTYRNALNKQIIGVLSASVRNGFSGSR